MYFIDSVTQRIDVFDFDGATGAISDRRGFADIPAAVGLPDGLVVDVEGGIWVCLFGGGAIRRYSEDGRLTEHLELPVTNPTCPAFGGPGLRDLYITSARHRLTDAQLAKEPHAGALLKLDPGVAGIAAGRFRPNLHPATRSELSAASPSQGRSRSERRRCPWRPASYTAADRRMVCVKSSTGPLLMT